MNTSPYQQIYDLCVTAYHDIVKADPKIDAGHSVNHVKKVEQLARKAVYEFVFQVRKNKDETIQTHIKEKYDGDISCLDVPDDVIIRIMIATLLHEVGDTKFQDKKVKTKVELILEILNTVLKEYSDDTEEMRQDIVSMIDYCSASTWGNRIPENSKIYQLIPRFCDRYEATGWIGIARTMTYSYVKRAIYPLVLDDDEFPTSIVELEKMAPTCRWLKYSSGKKASASGFSHYLDKIVHISGDDVPIPSLQTTLNEAQQIVKQFIVDFTIVHNKQFDIDLIVKNLDQDIYNVEIAQLKEMQKVMKKEGCKWIK
jgi:hypothetical protein